MFYWIYSERQSTEVQRSEKFWTKDQTLQLFSQLEGNVDYPGLGSSPKKPEIVWFVLVLVVVVVVVRQSGGFDIVRQRVWHCSISKINSRVKIWCGQVRGEVGQGEWEQIFTTFCDRPTFGSCWPWIMVTMIIIISITSIIMIIVIITTIICWLWTSLLSQSHWTEFLLKVVIVMIRSIEIEARCLSLLKSTTTGGVKRQFGVKSLSLLWPEISPEVTLCIVRFLGYFDLLSMHCNVRSNFPCNMFD